MKLDLVCKCGAKFKAPESFAGRKVLCTQCGETYLLKHQKELKEAILRLKS